MALVAFVASGRGTPAFGASSRCRRALAWLGVLGALAVSACNGPEQGVDGDREPSGGAGGLGGAGLGGSGGVAGLGGGGVGGIADPVDDPASGHICISAGVPTVAGASYLEDAADAGTISDGGVGAPSDAGGDAGDARPAEPEDAGLGPLLRVRLELDVSTTYTFGPAVPVSEGVRVLSQTTLGTHTTIDFEVAGSIADLEITTLCIGGGGGGTASAHIQLELSATNIHITVQPR